MLDTAQHGAGAVEGGTRSRDRHAPTVSCRDRRVPVGAGVCTLALLFAVVAVGGNDPATDTGGDGLLDDID